MDPLKGGLKTPKPLKHYEGPLRMLGSAIACQPKRGDTLGKQSEPQFTVEFRDTGGDTDNKSMMTVMP